MKEETASRCCSVDPIGQADELHIAALKVRNKLEELAHRLAKPIEFPNDKRVTRPQMRLRHFQPGAITPTSTHLIRKRYARNREPSTHRFEGRGAALLSTRVRSQ